MQTPAESYPGSSYFVHTLDNLLEVAGNPKYYFWYNTYQDKDDSKHRIETKFIYYDDEISVEEDNGIYTIKFLGVSGYSLISVEHDNVLIVTIVNLLILNVRLIAGAFLQISLKSLVSVKNLTLKNFVQNY